MLVSCLLAAGGTGCGANETVLQSGKATPGSASGSPTLPTFESELTEIKTAGFDWLYVIRRRDGGVLDSNDKATIKTATQEANRRVLADEGKAILVGSNYEASAAAIDPLRGRFDVSDISTGPGPSPSP